MTAETAAVSDRRNGDPAISRHGKRNSRRPYRRARFAAPALTAVLIGSGFYTYHASSSHAATSVTGRDGTAPGTAKPTTPPATAPAQAKVPSRARLCGQAGWPEKSVAGGAYIVQNDEWNSTAPECITVGGGTEFAVSSSSIYEPASGNPGGYPSIYSGCSAGDCTTGNKLPIRVSRIGPGMISSNWATTQPSSGTYDVSYDIWFNRTRSTSGAPDGGELMIWLAHRGGSQVAPAGRPVAHLTIGGRAYTVWAYRASGSSAYRVSYVMDRPAASVRGLDVGAIIADAAHRGYLAGTSYLLNVQAGFELWQGGSGLETRSFALNVR